MMRALPVLAWCCLVLSVPAALAVAGVTLVAVHYNGWSGETALFLGVSVALIVVVDVLLFLYLQRRDDASAWLGSAVLASFAAVAVAFLVLLSTSYDATSNTRKGT